MKFLYDTVIGRICLKLIMHTGILKLLAAWVRSPFSKIIIKPYISRNQIDMTDFPEAEFDSFADFFIRKKEFVCANMEPSVLISPCDGLLSVYPIQKDARMKIKNSWYSIADLVTDEETARYYDGGACLIFRLQASDYHHFCYIDNCYQNKAHFVEGLLHSVQPIACEKEPVYRLNRRMWSILETENFKNVAQIEVGALLVGGIVHEKENARARRGEEMGRFELAGSTILLLFHRDIKNRIKFHDFLWNGRALSDEVPVKMGQAVGVLEAERENGLE